MNPTPNPKPKPNPKPPEVGSQRTLPREDFAELVLQYALRCARFKEEGAPALRVVRVAPAPEGMVERPVVNYESVIGGMRPSYHPPVVN